MDLNIFSKSCNDTGQNDVYCSKCGVLLKRDGLGNPENKRGLTANERKLLIMLIPVVLIFLFQNILVRKQKTQHTLVAPVNTIVPTRVANNEKDGSVLQVMYFLVKHKEASQRIEPVEWGQVKYHPASNSIVRFKYRITSSDGQSNWQDNLFFIDPSGNVVFLYPMQE